MKWLCKLWGHKWEFHFISGIRADMKRVARTVKICSRYGCNARIQDDQILGEADPKEGYYSWGSAGPCYGCANEETCPQVPWKQGPHGGAFAWAKCPVSNFKLKEGYEHYFQGNTIIY